jgi:hypothetical protein
LSELLIKIVDDCNKKNNQVALRLKEFEDRLNLQADQNPKQETKATQMKRSTNKISFPEEDELDEQSPEYNTQLFFRDLISESKKSELIEFKCKEFPVRGEDHSFNLKASAEDLNKLDDPEYTLPPKYSLEYFKRPVAPKAQPQAQPQSQAQEGKLEGPSQGSDQTQLSLSQPSLPKLISKPSETKDKDRNTSSVPAPQVQNTNPSVPVQSEPVEVEEILTVE